MDQVAVETTLLSLWQRVLQLEKTVSELKNLEAKNNNGPYTSGTSRRPVLGRPVPHHQSEVPVSPLTGLDLGHAPMKPETTRLREKFPRQFPASNKNFHEWVKLDTNEPRTQPLPEYLPRGSRLDDAASLKLINEVQDHRTRMPENRAPETMCNNLEAFCEAPVGCALTEPALGPL